MIGRMKKPLLSLLFISLFLYTQLAAQLNMSLVGRIDYQLTLNDVWGWVAPDGTEYALVGTKKGLSIVSLASPENPQEVAFVAGPESTWRDIKTWGSYAYVSNENSGGLHIIDLTNLPERVTDSFWTVSLEVLDGGNVPADADTLSSIHNLFIDEKGFAYLAGSNLNRGGALILDLTEDPIDPKLVGLGPNEYAHDIYTRNDRMYTSEIYEGLMGVYDVSNKSNVTLLGATKTPYEFTHNVWLSDDGKVAFTTDERFTAPVAAYDVSDPANIVELDQFRPAATLEEGSLPHNVHVWNDWLVISYYFDGGIIVDASRPENLVEVGNFDTFFQLDAGTGAWGAYPYLPSRLVLVTDTENGLFVLQPNYVRAAWLEGTVRDSLDNQPIHDVNVRILSDQINTESTDLLGGYKTGQALPGTFEVRFFKPSYLPAVRTANLQNGELTILDVKLLPAPIHSISGITLMDAGGSTIQDAQVIVEGEQGRFETITDEEGLFTFENIFQGTYDIYVGRWGYHPVKISQMTITRDTSLTVELPFGYQDDFFFDFGWQSMSEGEDVRGLWSRGEPRGTYRVDGTPSNPEFDIEGDLGDQAYVTGNRGGGVTTDDVDDGIVTLISPVMDLTTYADPVLSYYAWFYNSGGNNMPDDSLVVKLTNGVDTIILENIKESSSEWRPEKLDTLRNLIDITDQMQLIFITGDIDPTGHLVEAAVDFVRVREADQISPVGEEDLTAAPILVFPNPFRTSLTLDFQAWEAGPALQIEVYNQLGQRLQVISGVLPGERFQLVTGDWEAGVYYLRVRDQRGRARTLRVVRL